MPEDELDVDIGATKASLSVRGEGVARVVDALVGFCSPVTEATGYLGDVLRVYRQENAMRAIARAQALAVDLGVNVKPVTPKFLVNWTESVSLESGTEDDDSITELWAGLLVSASQKEKPGHYLYRRILGEFTKDHADCILYFADKKRHGELSESVFSETAKKVMGFVNQGELHLSDEELAKDNLCDRINALEGCGIQISNVKLSSSTGVVLHAEKLIWDASSYEMGHYFNNRVLDMLVSNGVLKHMDWSLPIINDEYFSGFDGKYGGKKRGCLDIEAYTLTLMGRDFVLSCLGK